MAKYHIKRDGTPGICHASKGYCPLGGTENHFDTLAQAQKVADERMVSEFINKPIKSPDISMVDERTVNSNTLIQETYHDRDSLSKRYHLTELVQKNLEKSGHYGKRAGLLGECYASSAYAQELGLNNTIILNQEEIPVFKIQSDTGNLSNEDQVLTKTLDNKITKKLKVKKDVNQSLIRAIHYSKDRRTAVVQMGAPNMPDLAIVKGDNVEFVEVKDLHKATGSQVDSVSSDVGEHGLPIMDLSQYPKKIQDNLKYAGFNKTIGTNYTLNQLTYNDSLQYFVENQQKQGISHFSYIGRDSKLHDVSLKGNKEDIANKLQSDKVNGTLIMRSNQTINNVSSTTLNHWKKERAKAYFKNGQWPTEDKVPLNEFNLKKGQVSIEKNHLCVGEMVLPVKLNDMNDLSKINFNRSINLKNVKSRQMTFTGHLFQTK